jgi:hypothetical protein
VARIAEAIVMVMRTKQGRLNGLGGKVMNFIHSSTLGGLAYMQLRQSEWFNDWFS